LEKQTSLIHSSDWYENAQIKKSTNVFTLQCSHLKRDCLADKKKHPDLQEKIPASHARNDENALFFGYYFTIFKMQSP
jgi:hypothetical protein